MGTLQEMDAGIMAAFEMQAVPAIIMIGIIFGFRRTIRRSLRNVFGEA